MPEPATSPPVIITPSMYAKIDAYLELQRRGRQGDALLTGRWVREARERVFGPLDAWLRGTRP